MTSTDEVLKQQLLDRVAAELRGRLAPGAGEAAEAFARRYYAHVAPADLQGRDVTGLAGSALSIWLLGKRRRRGEILARVFNPRLDDHGWQTEGTVVELVNDDMPFLVDSVTSALTDRGLEVQLIVHPVATVRRDAEGLALGLDGTGGEAGVPVLESYIHVEVDRLGSDAELAAVEAALLGVLGQVRAAVEDWPAMRQRLFAMIEGLKASPPPLPGEEVEEAVAFLSWLAEDHFTFLGVRDYEFYREGGTDYLRALPGSGIGVLREEFRTSAQQARALTPEMSRFARQPELIFVTKTNHRSPVHRSVHMDYVGVKRFDPRGEVVGEWRLVGLFTSLSYRRLATSVPLLRRKVARVLERAGFDPRSHDGKALVHIIEAYPRDELFQSSDDELLHTALGILQLQERRRLALFVRRDPFERFVACLVFVPRDRYNTEMRRRMEAILERAFAGKLGATYTQVTDEPLARIQFFLATTPGAVPDFDVKSIEEALAEAARTWSDELHRVLVEVRDPDGGKELYRRYGEAFPTAYREAFGTAVALFDIDRLEEVRAGAPFRLHLYRAAPGVPAHLVRVKVFSRGEPRPLSEVLPLFENLGFKVIAERPYEVRVPGEAAPLWVRDFELQTTDLAAVDLHRVRDGLEEALSRAWAGEIESDGFNWLVLRADLAWREVMMLRAYCRYLRQTGIAYSQEYMAQTLAKNPAIARLLVALFFARFDPDRPAGDGGAGGRAEEIGEAVRRALDGVAVLDEDRILRRFWNLVRSTLRTNYFQPGADGGPKPYLAMKLDSRHVEELPKPRPRFEIFVYSPRVEAVHLRGGMVARGGIRWSDRPEDFRTEVLSLMKAQMVKNAVIVPVGAKGGFVVKRPPPERAELQAEGVECYKTLIRGLLDLTDNYAAAGVVTPPRVVRHDGDDPYLVVAADKGTATFSDIANGVAAEYGFWLGDAFASGGSAGYDHKKMGITARGAWESVKRHFRELGRDVQGEPFTCVGVGDMAGDVFGNAMLLSRHLKLLGAFNHLHVFVDPDPDPQASFAERQRLFALPRSSWADYDPARISPGGGVFERQAKSIPVSPEMRAAFALRDEVVTPVQLIQALLRARVALLWLGGIGTFVKASTESHAQVGDRANDAVRIDASEVGAMVVGEGANLGFTQRARIEFALAGGKINTDAIDNSGGVDTSDHEVNIKILLGEALEAGDLTRKQRDQLLVQMTDEVAELVLRDNYLQTQAITIAEAQGVEALDRQARLMRELEKSGRLDRALEALPDEETLAERQAAGRGLTRPEIAVLLAYSKITLYEQLLAGDLPDDPILAEDLALYFPAPLRERFAPAIRRHRLRREIATTHVTNSMVNRVGPTFVQRIESATGASASDIARAYTVVRDAFGLRSIWSAVEALDNRVPAEAQTRIVLETKQLVERAAPWLLRRRTLAVPQALATFGPGVAALAARLGDLLPPTDLSALHRRQKRFEKQGVPQELAARVASLDFLAGALDIIAIADQYRLPVEEVGQVYYLVGGRFSFDWLREAAEQLEAETPWQREAKAGLMADFYRQQCEVTARVLEDGTAGASSARTALEAWQKGRGAVIERARALLAELKSAGKVDLAMLAVARQQLDELAAV